MPVRSCFGGYSRNVGQDSSIQVNVPFQQCRRTTHFPFIRHQGVQERGGLQLVKTLILFNTSPAEFILPSYHGEMFSLVRLADFLGVEEFMEVYARVLEVSVDAISNHNPY